MQLGSAGEFDISADGSAAKTAAAIELFAQQPVDAPAYATLAIANKDVAIGGAAPNGRLTIVVSIGAADSTRPCTDGTAVGAFAVAYDGTAVTLELREIEVRGAALDWLRSGRFTICLEASGDVEATLQLAAISMRFGAAAGDDDEPPVVSAPAEVLVEANDDPNDPLICRLTNEQTRHVALLYGRKDANGMVTKIEQVEFREPQMAADEPGYAILLDEADRAVVMTGPGGEVANLSYNGDAVTIDFYDADGTEYHDTAPFGPAPRSAPAAKTAADPPAAAPRVSAEWTTVKLLGRLNVTLETREGSEPLRGDDVRIKPYCANGSTPPLALLNPNTDRYEFFISHRVKNVQTSIESCEAIAGGVGDITTATGGVLLLAGWYSGSGTAAAAFLTKVGALATVSGCAALGTKYTCRSLVLWAADVNEGEGRAEVYATVTSSRVDPPETEFAAEYNLYNFDDPIVKNREFEASIYVTDCVGYRDDVKALAAQIDPDNPDPGLECRLAKLELEMYSAGCMREPWDTAGMSIQEYLDDLHDRKERNCATMFGCWRARTTWDGGAGDVTHVFDIDHDANLERLWKLESGGVLIEAIRFPPLVNSPRFAAFLVNSTQSIRLIGQDQFDLTWRTDLRGDQDGVTYDAGSLSYEIQGGELSFGDPFDSFTGSVHYVLVGKELDEDGRSIVTDTNDVWGTVKGQRVDCPNPDDTNVYEQGEQEEMGGDPTLSF